MMYENDLIYGRDKIERVVSVEPDGNGLILFRELESGEVVQERIENTYWLITNRSISPAKEYKLDGNQYFRYLHQFDSLEAADALRKKLYQKRIDFYRIADTKEASLVFNGITYFKGMQPKEVSVLSFDIESDGLVQTENSEIYIITNTFRKGEKLVRKTFDLNDYPYTTNPQAAMLMDWCKWVREMDPSIMLGHNIYGYDWPYLAHVAKLNDVELKLGRDGSPLRFNNYTSKKRKDGSQDIEYFNCHIYGREIVDTMFLSITYDVARNFPSYGLKPIINHLGLEKPGRTFVDASKIKAYFYERETYPGMWEKAKQYAEEDSDDALKLFDLMVPAYFYMTQSISKTFQQIINSATGSQINNMMVRSYLQIGHSIAKADEVVPYEGALSLGIPGQYKNCVRWDIASLYPSIMRQYQIYSKQKDPKRHFLEMVEFFTLERLKNKQLAKDTGNQYYKDLESSQKTLINSKYGFLSAAGLNYNYPEGATNITKKGRQILGNAIKWASGKTVEELYAYQGTEAALEE
jgi:DNA polymerase, archaea type